MGIIDTINLESETFDLLRVVNKYWEKKITILSSQHTPVHSSKSC